MPLPKPVSKLLLYREAGVREYWICDPRRRQTYRYAFAEGVFNEAHPFEDPVPSTVLPGFATSLADAGL